MSQKNKFSRKQNNACRRGTNVVCQDCGKESRMSPRQRYGASRARCPFCGGTVNRPKDIEGNWRT